MATSDSVHTLKFDGKDQRKMQMQTFSVNKALVEYKYVL